ncbi:MAG TPA: hypothetical protein VGH53_08955 [Streptosporangiaceae bacterium]
MNAVLAWEAGGSGTRAWKIRSQPFISWSSRRRMPSAGIDVITSVT